jgi:hypothetical protein
MQSFSERIFKPSLIGHVFKNITGYSKISHFARGRGMAQVGPYEAPAMGISNLCHLW